jgi:CHAD domain-containing protein
MKKKSDISTQVFGAGVLLDHLQAFQAEIEGVRSGKDIEYIHRMRVASRRLRCTLPLFSEGLPPRKAQRWLKQITQITHELGAARDTDVQIEILRKVNRDLSDEAYKPGLNRLVLRLRQAREKLQRQVVNALDEIQRQQSIADLSEILTPWASRKDQVYLFTPALYKMAYEAVTSRLDDFLALEEYIYNIENIKKLHEMRIAAKWLRYTCETFAPLYSNGLKSTLISLRKTQESLGDLHDCDVWIQFIPEFMQKEEKRTLNYFGNLRPYQRLVPGLTYFLEEKRQQRQELHNSFLKEWETWKTEDIWGKLRQTIQVPFPQPEVPLPTEPPPVETLSQNQT